MYSNTKRPKEERIIVYYFNDRFNQMHPSENLFRDLAASLQRELPTKVYTPEQAKEAKLEEDKAYVAFKVPKDSLVLKGDHHVFQNLTKFKHDVTISSNNIVLIKKNNGTPIKNPEYERPLISTQPPSTPPPKSRPS